MKEFARVSRIILGPREICPYKNTCCFNGTTEKCYGALGRDNEFVCHLDKLRLMYNQRIQGELIRENIENDPQIVL